MKQLARGSLEKMITRLAKPVQYRLPVGDSEIELNPLIGKKIQLRYVGKINCVACGRTTNKSFNQGHCYPCFQKLASCDVCIMSPEKCHYAAGTCREPEWAQDHCMVDHIVYLSNTSGPKVGITRASQIPTRWIDQGAVQALPIMSVKTRHQSGLVEHALKAFVADKTSWQTMLKGSIVMHDLPALRENLLQKIPFASDSILHLDGAEVVEIDYPVEQYPQKVKSLDFDKLPLIEGELQGIKGQYLMLDIGVLNIRKFTAYEICFST